MAAGVIRGEFALSVFDEIYGSSALFIHPLAWTGNEPFRYRTADREETTFAGRG